MVEVKENALPRQQPRITRSRTAQVFGPSMSSYPHEWIAWLVGTAVLVLVVTSAATRATRKRPIIARRTAIAETMCRFFRM
jgi:hypothetical protein